jgi:three-Cys-motif partner protein
MVRDFFKAKRPWSEYKDSILRYYIEPYIPKVNQLRKPVLIIDCFAGPGQFDDGKPGSPVILTEAIKRWRDKGCNVSGEFIEAKPALFSKLKALLAPHDSYAIARPGTFEQHLPEIALKARHNTVFLYVDPYSVRSLVFDEMQKVYQQIKEAGSSVEVLLNFNVPIFMRWALAALKRHEEIPVFEDQAFESDTFGVDEANESVELSTLDAIAGGSYWREIAIESGLDFPSKLERFMKEYTRKMGASFKWIGWYGVKMKYEHQIPKYMLVYATRHPDGIQLMNDAMCKARRQFVQDQFPLDFTLFGPQDRRPAEELVDDDTLNSEVIELVPTSGTVTRKKIRLQVLEHHFCRYSSSDVNHAVGRLLKAGRIRCVAGKNRINDNDLLSR